MDGFCDGTRWLLASPPLRERTDLGSDVTTRSLYAAARTSNLTLVQPRLGLKFNENISTPISSGASS
jgi:hypothetical protein